MYKKGEQQTKSKTKVSSVVILAKKVPWPNLIKTLGAFSGAKLSQVSRVRHLNKAPKSFVRFSPFQSMIQKKRKNKNKTIASDIASLQLFFYFFINSTLKISWSSVKLSYRTFKQVFNVSIRYLGLISEEKVRRLFLNHFLLLLQRVVLRGP